MDWKIKTETDKETGKITQRLITPAFGALDEQVTQWVMDTRESSCRDALIALGWTPPGPSGLLPPVAAVAVHAVLAERDRQDAKWGVQNHPPEWWLAILMEEVGDLAHAILETHLVNGTDLGGIEHIRKEAVQCAAVAMAMIECIDRQQTKGTPHV